MPASKSSELSPSSEAFRKAPRKTRSKAVRSGSLRSIIYTALVFAGLAALSCAAVVFFYGKEWLLYYGDAEAHLNIARRIVDSREPGYRQIGTVWLPLPHLLMLPLVRFDEYWRSGLAGAIPNAACFVVAGTLLFLAARRLFASVAAALAAVALFALNPNTLYLQSIPMSESVFFATLAGILYCIVRYYESRSLLAAAGAGISALAASMSRYEGWFLLPFIALFFLLTGGERRWRAAILFSAIAGLGPLYWLAHNWWFFGNLLEFYNGPNSAKGIYQRSLDAGMARYPGDHNWAQAWLQLRSAAQLCVGLPLWWLGLIGAGTALLRRAFWPLLLLALPPIFYLWSVHSGSTPIFVPHLWPHSHYNTRYGMSFIPLLAFGAAALVAIAPPRLRGLAALAAMGVGISVWVLNPQPETWICWRESQANSKVRRAWTHEAASYLAAEYRPGEGILTSFSDLTGILREAGIPLRASVFQDSLEWQAAIARPELFLNEKWAIGISGDPVTAAIIRAQRNGPRYECVKIINFKGGPVIEIYKRAAPQYRSWLEPGVWQRWGK